MIGRKFLIFPVLLLIILAIGSASASDEIALEDVTINHDIVETPLIEEIEGDETPNAEDAQTSKTTKTMNQHMQKTHKQIKQQKTMNQHPFLKICKA